MEGHPVEEQWWEERIKGPTLWLALSLTGSTSLGETILFLSESVTSEALEPQMVGRHLEHRFLVFRI